MSDRERTTFGFAIKSLAGVAMVAGLAMVWVIFAKPKLPAGAGAAAKSVAARVSEQSTLAEIAAGIKAGDGMALAVLQKRLAVEPGALLSAIDEQESAAWIQLLRAIGQGYPRFAPYGRSSAVLAALRVMERYAVAPAPVEWSESLEPVYAVASAALNDADATVRTAVVQELGRFWKWSPGREMETTGEIDYVSDWKEAIYAQLVGKLADADGSVRARAVGALSALPIDIKAAPAAAHVKDPSFEVRLYVLAGFADRRALLDEEAIVPLLYDPVPAVATSAENVLKNRGLSSEQIGLSKLIVHPLSHMRSSVIPMLQTRADIDPTVWLIFLSRDKDQNVQMKAVEALGQSESVDARQRLVEMANDNQLAPSIRAAASKFAPAETKTVALPPLPGSPSLNPRAN